MLYLHIGMWKTGTTSLQRILATNAPALALQGYLYPRRWTMGRPGGHYALNSIDRSPDRAPALSRDVRRYLVQNRGRKVVLSTEGLAHSLLHEPGRKALAAFLELCSEAAEPRVIMALRRFDEYHAAAYLQVTKTARAGAAIPPAEFVRRRSRPMDMLFGGLRWLREEAGATVTLIPYAEGKDILPAVLRAMGIEQAGTLESGAATTANRRLGLKAHIVLSLPDGALARLGVRRGKLIKLFESGAFAFRDEVYDFDLLGHELRSRIHRRALEEARRHGIDEYVNAFAGVTLPATTATRFDTSLISGADLLDLTEAIAAQRATAA